MMMLPELPYLELLAEVDALAERVRRWAASAPDWQPAEACRALARRLDERTQTFRVRLAAPLVVATLGGTGTGKSALVNALVGDEVVATGRRRPTTCRPAMVCRPGITPEPLGIDPACVDRIERDTPALADLVLIDCPDPDTAEPSEPPRAAHRSGSATAGDSPPAVPSDSARDAAGNLDRLRRILPHCDVILVTATQEKYRSARVADELAAAAPGAQLVFVQTRADVDTDIREDWRSVLQPRYVPGRIFRVDSIAALADARAGREPRGDFAALVELLTRQLAGAAAARIRRANFLDLVSDVLDRCRARLDEAMPAVAELRDAVEKHRRELTAELAMRMRDEGLANRRLWESRLVDRVAARWGLSPFSLLLRVYQGFGALVMGRLLWRARGPAQLALWGAVGASQWWRQSDRRRRAEAAPRCAAAACLDAAKLRAAALVLEGYASDAGMPKSHAAPPQIQREAERAVGTFAVSAAVELDDTIGQLAARKSGWFTRLFYESLLAAMLGWILYRLGRNYFVDSWIDPSRLLGTDFYLQSLFWLAVWCLGLLWLFSRQLRAGLRRAIQRLAERWGESTATAGMFGALGDDCRRAERFREELDELRTQVERLRRRLAAPDSELGRRRAEPSLETPGPADPPAAPMAEPPAAAAAGRMFPPSTVQP